MPCLIPPHPFLLSIPTTLVSSLPPSLLSPPSPPSPPISPLPPLPPLPANSPSPLPDPLTPARNPASIDRRALVGVGELTTPRWAKDDHHEDHHDAFDIAFSRNQDP